MRVLINTSKTFASREVGGEWVRDGVGWGVIDEGKCIVSAKNLTLSSHHRTANYADPGNHTDMAPVGLCVSSLVSESHTFFCKCI